MAAWPKWVASYGVMPHVYMVTSGPGSNGTTAWRAVSYSRMGAVGTDRLVAGVGLGGRVRHVELGMPVNFTATRVL